MSLYLNISANFRIGETLPTIEDQYRDLWKFASSLAKIGLPLQSWHPPARTPDLSRTNYAFDAHGATPAAIALARADKSNHALDLRALGVWNGEEGTGGMSYTTTYIVGRIPSFLDLNEESVEAFEDYNNLVQLVIAIVEIWEPMIVKVTPWGYDEHSVFPDRPPVGWMLYLPFKITESQVPEAGKLVYIPRGGKIKGTIIVATTDLFKVENSEHVRTANAIEARLVDQDLLPTLAELVQRT